MKAATSKQIREIDRISIEEIGIPAAVLMNNAGMAVADAVYSKFKDSPVIIFCGSGNNGGDGFTTAYYLHNKGIDVKIYLSCPREEVSETSNIFLKICDYNNIPITEINFENLQEVIVPKNAIIIDATLGIGFSGKPRGIILEFIKIINSSESIIFSIDIPGGLPSDGTCPDGETVIANYTVTMGIPKISLVTYPGKEYTGELIVADIGFPSYLTSTNSIKNNLMDLKLAQTIMNQIPQIEDIYKGSRGHTLLIGGFSGMEGAILLTVSALFETGCGLATILTTDESRSIIAGKIPEAMTASLLDNPDESSLKSYFTQREFRTIVIGPGMGRSDYAGKIFNNTMKALNDMKSVKVLIDGDGLFHFAEYLKNYKISDNVDYIITPHFMEASRILGDSVSTIKKNRYSSCNKLSLLSGAVTILKGPCSIISDGENTFINTTGNKRLATAGSGDVLSGITASLLNSNLSTVNACALGAYIHGRCADISLKTNCAITKARDIIENIKIALFELKI